MDENSADPTVEPLVELSDLPEALSPEDVEKAAFHTTPEGYDKVEVEVFLRAVAEDMRALKKDLESARLGSHRPLEALGREMGALMQHAHDAADRVRKNAETEATTTIQKAQRDAAKARQEAEQLKKKYETETLIARDEAMAAVVKLREQAEQQRRLAEAESSIMQQEAWRTAKRIQDEAKRRAQENLVKVDSEAQARTAESERRLRKLQEIEAKLRRRIEFLSARLQAMTEQVKQAMAEEEAEREEEPAPADARSDRTPSIRITDAGTIRIDDEEGAGTGRRAHPAGG